MSKRIRLEKKAMAGKNGAAAANGKRHIMDMADIPVSRASEYVEVSIPEWDTDEGPAVVLLRRVSQGERKHFTSQGELGVLSVMSDTERDRELARWRDWYDSGKRDIELIRMSYVRPDGRPLFSEAQIHELMGRSDARPWVRLVEAAEVENLITASAVTDFQKNSPTLRSAGHTALPAPSASPIQA